MRRVLALVALTGSLSCDILGSGNVLAGPNVTFVVQPSATAVGSVISPAVQVEVRDRQGRPLDTYTEPIIVHLQDGPTGAVLQGTVSRPLANGRAVFNDLRVDRAGSGYRLMASSGGLTPQVSAPFAIIP
jgi:hypothetical protein